MNVMPSGPLTARIMLVVDAPTQQDALAGQILSGSTGFTVNGILHEVGILRHDCFTTAVLRRPITDTAEVYVPRKTKPKTPGEWLPVPGGWGTPELQSSVDLLRREIEKINPMVIIPMGDLALWTVAGVWGVHKWRGSMLSVDGRKVIPTLPPGYINAVWADRRYAVIDMQRVVREMHSRDYEVPQYHFIIRPQYDHLINQLLFLEQGLDAGPMHIACDIETRAGHIACVGLGWSREDALCIPFMCVENDEGYWPFEQEVTIVQKLRRILEHPNARISGQNFIYDAQYLWRYFKIKPRLALDTMISHHACFPGTEKGLDILSSLYCRNHVYWKDDGKEWSAKTGEDQLWIYNCTDCVRTWEIAEALQTIVQSMNLVEQCVFQHQMWWHAFGVMLRGARTDLSARAQFSVTLAKEKEAREAWLTDILGHPLNVRSGPQMKSLFYEDFRLPVQRNRKTGQPSLDDEAMSKLCVKEPLIRPIVRKIREIRSLGVFRSTFVEARLDVDQRTRCSYNIAGTETFRLSSSENAFGSGLNLQNIPKGGAEDNDPDALELPNVRTLYIPDPGYEIADMDLNAADLRIVVWEADEPKMKAMLAAGLDPYTEIAKEYYHDSSITKADSRRQKFKSFAHGTHYLGTPRGLAPRLGLSVAEVERTQRWYFGRFPRIAKWQAELKSKLSSTRRVRNIFGYHRHFFERIEGTIYNQAAAWIPQSTVGLLINKIWDRIEREESEVQVLFQVHDSLVMQYPIIRAEYYRARLQELSLIALPYADPCIIPTGFKYSQKSWGDCE